MNLSIKIRPPPVRYMPEPPCCPLRLTGSDGSAHGWGVNCAVAVAMAWDAQTELTVLLRLEHLADAYYPYHAARADLLRRTRQREAASDACQCACDLCSNHAERIYLQRQLDEMKKSLK